MSVPEAPLRAAPTAPTMPTNQRLTPLLFVGLMLGLLLAELDQTMFPPLSRQSPVNSAGWTACCG
jgi:hypothetical protein